MILEMMTTNDILAVSITTMTDSSITNDGISTNQESDSSTSAYTIDSNEINTTSAFHMINSTATSMIQAFVASNNAGPSHLFRRENNSRELIQSQNEIRLSELSLRYTFEIIFFSILIFITIFGNTLVILSLITTRRLRTVTNCFVMSLAVADWMVGVFVMPPAVWFYIYASWNFGRVLCDIWISLDILLCTASILSLCAISLDRYLAVTQPLSYKKRRTKGLAMLMILVVWILAILITCPPILGWYEPGRNKLQDDVCRYNRNKGYVIFSAMGSFFIPMIVMLYVYSRICCVLTSRHNSIAKTEASEKTNVDEIDCDNMTSDYESGHSPKQKSFKRQGTQCIRNNCSQKSFDHDDSHHTLYELVELSKSTSTIRSSSLTCKYSTCLGIQSFRMPSHSVHFSTSQTSIADSCSTGGKNRINSGNGKRMPIRISSMKRETKAAQTLSMVVGGFIACWLPFFIYYLLIPFLPTESDSALLMSFLTWLGWINSAINPFIYAFYNPDFRIAFWRLTFRKCCKNKNSLMFVKS